MRSIKILLVIVLTTGFLIGCNKDKVDQKSTEKLNEKKDALTEKKYTENKEVANKNSDDIKLFKVESVEKLSGKKVAPNFTWSENGKKMSLKELKGNVVLVNLWATWCGPCIKEMPDLSKVSEELKDEDFLKTNPVSYVILDGNKEIVDAFGEANGSNIEAVPTTFIIDKEGKIAETIIGGRSKDAFLSIINKYLN
jgi:thiol-disulfide isomerase/thioredoxin